MFRVVLLSMTILLSVAAAAEPELKGTPSQLRQHLHSLPGQVVLKAYTERRVSADQAIVSLRITTSHRHLQAAMDANNSQRQQILQELQAVGLDVHAAGTSSFASTPIDSWLGNVKEYKVASNLRLPIDSDKHLRQIAGLVDTLESVSLGSIEYQLSSQEALKLELLEEAFSKLQQQEEIYEQSLHVQLLPRTVQHQTQQRKPDTAFDEPIITTTSGGMVKVQPAMPPSHTSFQQVLISVTVTTTFDLLQEP